MKPTAWSVSFYWVVRIFVGVTLALLVVAWLYPSAEKQGARGPAGVQGVAGADGQDGEDGADGDTGARGKAGKDGGKGNTGAAGANFWGAK